MFAARHPLACQRDHGQWAMARLRNQEIAKRSDLGGAIQITNGRYFWPLQPDHEGNDVDIEFIAHVLAGERRWGGVIEDRYGDPSDYSVAQHSVHVADIVNLNRKVLVPGGQWDTRPSPAFYGLMHDSSEAYLKDFPRPIKMLMEQYYPAESALMARILSEFNVPVDGIITEAVRRVDNMMIFMEREELVGSPVAPYYNENENPRIAMGSLVPDFHVWDAKTAKRRFLEKFEEIVNHDGNHIPLSYANRGFLLAA